FLGQMGDRVRLNEALDLAAALLDGLRSCPGIERMELCGSLRRRKEAIHDINILVSSKDPGPVMDRFVSLPGVVQVAGHGETMSSIVVEGSSARGRRVVMNADLRVVRDEQFPFALHYFTGSKDHNVAMHARAQRYGLKLSEYELTGPGGRVPC